MRFVISLRTAVGPYVAVSYLFRFPKEVALYDKNKSRLVERDKQLN